MGEVDTFGITLPVTDWRVLFALAERADRAPSDFLRVLIRDAARECGLVIPDQPKESNGTQFTLAWPSIP
jgi:hypothetical protein